jgi:hypothetical protein
VTEVLLDLPQRLEAVFVEDAPGLVAHLKELLGILLCHAFTVTPRST